MAEKKNQHSYHACFDLNREDEARAWKHLEHRDRKKHKSISQAIVAAVNAYFEGEQAVHAKDLLPLESVIESTSATFDSEQLRQIMREEMPNALTMAIQNLLMNGIQANLPMEVGKVHQKVHENPPEDEIADSTLAFLLGE